MHDNTATIEALDLATIRYPIAPGAEVTLTWVVEPGIMWKPSRLALEPPEVLEFLELRSLSIAHRERVPSPMQLTESLEPVDVEWPVMKPLETLKVRIYSRAPTEVEVICTPVGMMRRF